MIKSDLSSLPNIGEVLKQNLTHIGIDSVEKLMEFGSVQVYKMLKAAGLNPCYNTLYALEGAVRKIRWHQIDKAELEQLKHHVQNSDK